MQPLCKGSLGCDDSFRLLLLRMALGSLSSEGQEWAGQCLMLFPDISQVPPLSWLSSEPLFLPLGL